MLGWAKKGAGDAADNESIHSDATLDLTTAIESDVPRNTSKVSAVIDVALTRNHHDYYGEEWDPGLAALLDRENEGMGNADNETVDVTITAIDIPVTARLTRTNPPPIAQENVQIINEGNNVENDKISADKFVSANENDHNGRESVNLVSLATPSSIDVRDNRVISSPMSVSVREQTTRVPVTDQEQPWPPSCTSPVRSARTARSVDMM